MATIASIVTALGESAVSIIRISGEESWSIASKLTGRDFEANKFQLAWIKEQDNKVDQVLILPFKNPQSFTGEDVIEIHCHGGVWITNKILDLVLSSGARLAKAGEFTERAFLNHKLDLSQAEAIMDMVSAKAEQSGKNAVNIYQGYLGDEILAIRKTLMTLLGEVVAGIDFPDEVGDFDADKFTTGLKEVIAKIDNLLASEKEGHILRHGYKVALVGDPNVGKSSLLNTLLKNERAIVTDVAGTTRDLIEESYSLKGIPIVLIDTAGIRESEDKVERIGIARTKQAVTDANLLLLLDDLSAAKSYATAVELKESFSLRFDLDLQGKSYLTVGTKSDLDGSAPDLYDVKISSTQGENIEQLKDLLHERILQESSQSQVKVNERQADLLRQSKASLEKALAAVQDGLPQDFWTIDSKAALDSLGEITGAVVTEELLTDIFKSFCIGK